MKSFEAKLISSVPNIVYLTNFSGFSETERDAFIILTENKKFLITDKRYSEAVKKKVKDFEVIDTGALNFLIHEGDDFFKDMKIKSLFIEENDLKVSEFISLKKYIKLKRLDTTNFRIIKSDLEIKHIKEACGIADQSFEFILTKLKSGVTEKEISHLLINFFKSKNADLSFPPIVAFGENSSVPHHESGNTKLSKNQIVLLDFGVKINNYCSDMTRTVFFGKADPKFRKIYNTVLNSQKKAIDKIKPNLKTSIIDKAARDYIIGKNFPDIIHAVGHGIGIEVHEAPSISPTSIDKIKNGMVFSVEPGIYILGYGGVRIEDLILVRNGFAELISLSKKGIIEIND